MLQADPAVSQSILFYSDRVLICPGKLCDALLIFWRRLSLLGPGAHCHFLPQCQRTHCRMEGDRPVFVIFVGTGWKQENVQGWQQQAPPRQVPTWLAELYKNAQICLLELDVCQMAQVPLAVEEEEKGKVNNMELDPATSRGSVPKSASKWAYQLKPMVWRCCFCHLCSSWTVPDLLPFVACLSLWTVA